MVDSYELDTLIGELKRDQRQRWLRHEPVFVESYLKEHGDLSSQENTLLDLVYSEYCLRDELGEKPSAEEYVSRFPGLADRLRQLFAATQNSENRFFQAKSADPLATTHRSGFEGKTAPANDGTVDWSDSDMVARAGQADEFTVSEGEDTARAKTSPTRYRKLRAHDAGGLGEVFVAYDEELHRHVALKEIKRSHASDPRSQSRFVLEAEVTGRLEHPGIVPVYGMGSYADGRPYYAMRFIKGDSLKRAINRFHKAEGPNRDPGERALELRNLLSRFIQVCHALEYAHSRGVLHRDIKPDNIMLGKFGETLVIDWGLAQPLDPAKVADETQTLRPVLVNSSMLTQKNEVVGTICYMSPEQAGGRVDLLGPASDIYSLAATLYTLLTGTTLFNKEDVLSACEKLRRGDFVRPRDANPNVAPALEAICVKGLCLKAEDRYPSAMALAEDIERWLADEPVSAYREPVVRRLQRWARRHRAAVSAAASLLVAVVVLGSAWGYHEVTRTQEVRLRAQHEMWTGIEAQKGGMLTEALARYTDAGARAQERPALAALALDAGHRRQEVEGLLATQTDFERFRRYVSDQLREAKFHTIFDDLGTGRDICRKVLAVFDAQGWIHKLDAEVLSAEAVKRCREDVAELLVLLARDEVDLATDRNDALGKAVVLLDRAEAVRRERTRAIHELRSQCYAGLGQVPRAAEEARRAKEIQPASAFDYFMQGEIARRQGQLAAAIDNYLAALDKEPDHFWSHSMLGVCWLGLGEPSRALAAYDQAIRLRPSFAGNYASRALAHADLEEWQAGLADLAKAEEIDPAFYGIYNNRGVLLYKQAISPRLRDSAKQREDLFAEAVRQFERARGANPAFSGALNNLGNVHRERFVSLGKAGQVDDAREQQKAAIADYTQALALNPRDRQARVNRAITYNKAGDFSAALADLQAVVESNRDDVDAHFALANLHEDRGRQRARAGDDEAARRDFVESIAQYDRVVAKRTTAYGPYLGRARARYELFQLTLRGKAPKLDAADPQTIERDLNAAERLGGDTASVEDRAALYAMRGVVRANQNQYQGALADYDRALRYAPDRASLRLRRGWALALGRDHAREDFDAALKNPQNLDNFEAADVHNGRGYVLALAGEDRKAVLDADEAVKRAPKNWEVLFNAAAIYGLATGVARIERSDAKLASQYSEQAVALLEKAIDAGLSDKQLIRSDRSFVHLRGEKAFAKLVK